MQAASYQQAFIQAIVDSPADDTPRLVYADWLDEQGESARAEFIRVQCELARLGYPRRQERGVLKKHGPNYFDAAGTVDEQWRVGERVDWLDQWNLVSRKTRKIGHRSRPGLLVTRIIPEHPDDPDDADDTGSVTVVLKEDELSIPVPMSLVERERRIFNGEDRATIRSWGCGGWIKHTRSRQRYFGPALAQRYALALFTRGFVSHVALEFGQVNACLKPLLEQQPIEEVRITNWRGHAVWIPDIPEGEDGFLAYLKRTWPLVPKWDLPQ